MTRLTPHITVWLPFPYPVPNSMAQFRRCGNEMEVQVEVRFEENRGTDAKALAGNWPRALPPGYRPVQDLSKFPAWVKSPEDLIQGSAAFTLIQDVLPIYMPEYSRSYWLVKIRFSAPIDGWKTKMKVAA